MDRSAQIVKDLSDKQEVEYLLCQYAIVMDTREWNALDLCFAAGATIEITGMGSYTVPAFKLFCAGFLADLDATQHCITTAIVRINGTGANSRSYSVAYHVRNALAPDFMLTVGGQYDDVLERTQHGWRITHRTATIIWMEGNRAVLGIEDARAGTEGTTARQFPPWLGPSWKSRSEA